MNHYYRGLKSNLTIQYMNLYVCVMHFLINEAIEVDISSK